MPRICVQFYPELKLITLSSHFPSGTTPMMHHAFLTTTHALVRLLINHPVYGRGHSFLPVSSVRAVALGVCVGNRRERGRETCGEGLSKNNSSWWRGKATGSWQTGTSPGYMSSCEGPQLGEEIKPECFSSTWSWPFLNIAPSLSFVCARTASAPVVRPSRPPLGLLTEVPQVFQRGLMESALTSQFEHDAKLSGLETNRMISGEKFNWSSKRRQVKTARALICYELLVNIPGLSHGSSRGSFLCGV